MNFIIKKKNISGSQCKSINENKTMPENNNIQSFSILSESKKEFTSLNTDKKSILYTLSKIIILMFYLLIYKLDFIRLNI